MFKSVYIGLGSNLEQPALQIDAALKALDSVFEINLITCSQSYASTPQGPQDQPDFVNAVCQIETTLTPLELLACLQSIERSQGRIKKRHWGERLIDLDILLFEDQFIVSSELTVPHVELPNRDFVLIPLAEIAPGLVVSNYGTVEQMIAKLTTSYLMPLDQLSQE